VTKHGRSIHLAVSMFTASVLGLGLGVIAFESGSAAAAPNARHVVSTHVTGNKAVFGVKATRPGWAHIRNSRSTPLSILRGTGQGAGTLASDYNRSEYTASQRRFPIATTLDPRSDAYIHLRRGEYFVISAEHRGTWNAGQIGVLSVSGSALNSALPRANQITLDKHRNIHAATTLKRLPYARLDDQSTRFVDIEAIAIDPSTSEATVQHFLLHPSLKRIPTLSARPTYTLAQTSAPNAIIYNPEHLKKGREMLVSFHSIDDKLHRGQARLVTVD
jgi:hypothetical protein